MLIKLSKHLSTKEKLPSVTWLLDSFEECSPIYEKDEHKLKAFKEKVCTVDDFMKIFRCYCSFFNFELLEMAFESSDYEDGQNLLSRYKENFAKYAKYLVTHCPSGVGMGNVDHANVYVKLDDAYKGCKMEHLVTLKKDLCTIFGLKDYHVLQLERVESGCISVVFHLPLALKNKLFPLSLEQVKALKRLSYNEAKVLRISCSDYSLEVNHEQGMCICVYIYTCIHYYNTSM